MSIIRVSHQENYVVIKKTALEDPRLSFKAKGLWAYCMSRPNNWEFHVSHLATVSKESKTAIYSSFDELIECGYCKREQIFESKGKGGGRGTFKKLQYTIYEEPQNSNNFSRSGFLNPKDMNAQNQPLLSIEREQVLKKKERERVPAQTPAKPAPPPLLSFGEKVKLTQEAYDKFCSDHGKEAVKEMICKVNDYLAATGAKPYKDYAAALRNWFLRERNFSKSKEPEKATPKEAEKNARLAEEIIQECKDKGKPGIDSGTGYLELKAGERNLEQVRFDDAEFRSKVKHWFQERGIVLEVLKEE